MLPPTATRFSLATLIGAALVAGARAGEPTKTPTPPGMRMIPAGVYRPLFRGENDPKEIAVKSFLLDATPVTNDDFLRFVRANPKWQRSQVKRLFADESYLKHWRGDLDLGPDRARV